MDRRVTREALRLMEAHQPFVRCTVVRAVGSVPAKPGASMLVRADRTTLGTVGGAALEEKVKALAVAALERRAGDLVHYDLNREKPGGLPSLCGGSVDVAIEFVPANPHLLVWGGGHVSRALADLLPGLEYDFSVADDRPEWVARDRFPEADRLEVVAPDDLFDRFRPGDYTHLYVLGYDAVKDAVVLRHALHEFPNFIGFIASEAKRSHLFRELREAGIRASALDRIHAPVGLAIGAQSPQEIAVSIVAEIIQGLHPATPTAPSGDARPRLSVTRSSATDP